MWAAVCCACGYRVFVTLSVCTLVTNIHRIQPLAIASYFLSFDKLFPTCSRVPCTSRVHTYLLALPTIHIRNNTLTYKFDTLALVAISSYGTQGTELK
jgi:hypothetical protein